MEFFIICLMGLVAGLAIGVAVVAIMADRHMKTENNRRFRWWNENFKPLAIYNSEIGRGIKHTDEYVKAMAILQDDYNRRIRVVASEMGIQVWSDKK